MKTWKFAKGDKTVSKNIGNPWVKSWVRLFNSI